MRWEYGPAKKLYNRWSGGAPDEEECGERRCSKPPWCRTPCHTENKTLLMFRPFCEGNKLSTQAVFCDNLKKGASEGKMAAQRGT